MILRYRCVQITCMNNVSRLDIIFLQKLIQLIKLQAHRHKQRITIFDAAMPFFSTLIVLQQLNGKYYFTFFSENFLRNEKFEQ